MKEKWVIGNWKMNFGLLASAKLAKVLSKKYSDTGFVSRVIKRDTVVHSVVCPSYTSLLEVAKFLQKSSLAIGAQDMFWHDKGAYTGEVSPLMLTEVGCDYVIIGHSERRAYIGETEKMINDKVKMAVASSLIPIVCVGETLEDRNQGKKEYVVMQQVQSALDGVNLPEDGILIVAYEPVWAVGTGNAVAPSEVVHMHNIIRQTLPEIFPQNEVDKNIKIVYGGSVSSDNAASFTSNDEVDGLLVGNASLKSAEFLKIISEVRRT